MKKEDIPGYIQVEWREYRYILCNDMELFETNLFYELTNYRENSLIIKHGGMISENIKLILPTMEVFFGISYRGDIEGWRNQIESAVEQMGILYAKIEGDFFFISDGRVFDLNELKVYNY